METQRWMDGGLGIIRSPEFRDGVKRLAKRIPPEALELLGLTRANGVALVAGAASVFVAGVATGASIALLAGPDGAKNRATVDQAFNRLKTQVMDMIGSVEHAVPTEDGTSVRA